MTELGRYNRLRISRLTDLGALLDAGELGEILLPRRYLDDSMQPGAEIEVFVYRDSEDRAVATLERPLAQVGECAYLKVVGTSKFGVFLDWGLPKDLLVPFSEQHKPMQKGYSYTVFLYIDELTQRIVASSRLEKYLSLDGRDFKPRQPVECLIYGRSDLGFKAVVDGTHLGQFYDSETFRRLHYGERIDAYIKQVRQDGKIDLVLQLPSQQQRDRLGEAILEHLRQNRGVSTLTDNSPPDDIYRVFGVSKANYKKALGRLYKQRAILIEKQRITLLSQ
jgi:predicted RNA-binding protein (virulence factor B family)